MMDDGDNDNRTVHEVGRILPLESSLMLAFKLVALTSWTMIHVGVRILHLSALPFQGWKQQQQKLNHRWQGLRLGLAFSYFGWALRNLVLFLAILYFWLSASPSQINRTSETMYLNIIVLAILGVALEVFSQYLEQSSHQPQKSLYEYRILPTSGVKTANQKDYDHDHDHEYGDNNEFDDNNNDDDNDESKNKKLQHPSSSSMPRLTWRLSWLLLFLSSYCFTLYYTLWKDTISVYDYVGPMRITRQPTATYMDQTHIGNMFDSLQRAFPNLTFDSYHGSFANTENEVKNDDYYYLSDKTNPNKSDKVRGHRITGMIVAGLQVSWGKEWGCRSALHRWNTNWPTYYPCTSFICLTQPNNTSVQTEEKSMRSAAYKCHRNQSKAYEATQECLEDTFHWSRLRRSLDENKSGASSVSIATVHHGFDQNTPPWEDSEFWPSITRYGRCDISKIGTTREIWEIEQIARNANLYWWLGLSIFLLWLLTATILIK